MIIRIIFKTRYQFPPPPSDSSSTNTKPQNEIPSIHSPYENPFYDTFNCWKFVKPNFRNLINLEYRRTQLASAFPNGKRVIKVINQQRLFD